MCDENSGLVKVWVNLVQCGPYTAEQVPALGNLREAVRMSIEAQTATQAEPA